MGKWLEIDDVQPTVITVVKASGGQSGWSNPPDTIPGLVVTCLIS